MQVKDQRSENGITTLIFVPRNTFSVIVTQCFAETKAFLQGKSPLGQREVQEVTETLTTCLNPSEDIFHGGELRRILLVHLEKIPQF